MSDNRFLTQLSLEELKQMLEKSAEEFQQEIESTDSKIVVSELTKVQLECYKLHLKVETALKVLENS